MEEDNDRIVTEEVYEPQQMQVTMRSRPSRKIIDDMHLSRNSEKTQFFSLKNQTSMVQNSHAQCNFKVEDGILSSIHHSRQVMTPREPECGQLMMTLPTIDSHLRFKQGGQLQLKAPIT